MRWLTKLRAGLQYLIHRSQVEEDLEDELRDYIERETEREAALGTAPDEARRRALRSLGGAERLKEACRDARGVRWVEDTVGDVRFAVRTLRKSGVFTVTVVAALALCIGASAAIYSVVDTVLFRPLAFPEQDRLVAVTEGVPGLGFPVLPFACPDYLYVAAHNRAFAATGTYRTQSYEISGAGLSRRLTGARVTASLFDVLGVRPAYGRAFTAEEDADARRVAVVASGFAESVFGGTGRALGRTIYLDRSAYTVIGVMPRWFSFPISGSRFNDHAADVFVPVSWSNEDRQQTVSGFDYSMVARLRPGVTIGQASADIGRMLKRVVEDYPANLREALSRMPKFSLESETVPFREEYTGNVKRPLLLLLAAAGIVLLIGCADVANLMLSRMVGRQREFALRTALGAGRWRVARQSLIEGLVLSAAGGALGLCAASWALPVLVRLAPDNLPRLSEIGLNWRVMAFTAAVTLATPLVFCLGPLVNTFRTGLVTQLRGEGRTSTQGRPQRAMMSAAVISQFALAFVLLTMAGLLTRSLAKAAESDPGFRAEHLVKVAITLPKAIYKKPEQIAGFFDRLLSGLSALPGVREAGAVSDLPMGSTSNVVISIQGGGRGTERVDTVFCRGRAMESLGVTLLRGRLLRPEDQIGAPHSVVISESLARGVWHGGDPIGKRIRFGVDMPINDAQWMSVVGVVGDVKARLDSDAPRALLFLAWRDWVNQMDVVVRTSNDPLRLAGAIRSEVSRLDPGLAVGRVETVNQVLDKSLAAERFRTWLLASFAIAALLLAMLGIGGLLLYDIEQRRREFGVRFALGADRRAVLILVLRRCLRLSGIGIGVGLLVSVFAARALGSLLYGISWHDAATFIAAPSILGLIGLAASILPAWRAMHTDPIIALRAG